VQLSNCLNESTYGLSSGATMPEYTEIVLPLRSPYAL